MSGCARRASVPFGPFTLTFDPSILTSTPWGIAIGLRPIRLISTSPHECQHFAADALFLRLTVGHQPAGRGHDRDAEPAEHARDPVPLRIYAKARLRDALQAYDRLLAVRAVLQIEAEHGALVAPLHLPVPNVALALQDVGDADLYLGRRHTHLILLRSRRIANPRKHVGDRIGHRHVPT